MPVVSLTRLRLRSLRFYPAFMWHSLASVRQLTRSQGFVKGLLASEGNLAFWTISVWRDEAAMHMFRDTNAHLAAMPKLLNWCDEASVSRFKQEADDLPNCAKALAHMQTNAQLSKVRYPSEDHKLKRLSPSLTTPKPGLRIFPINTTT